MLFSPTLITGPTVEPVTLTQLKEHLRIDAGMTADDAILGLYLVAARQYAEKYTRRAFLPQQCTLNLDHFPLWRFSNTLNSSQRRDFPYFGVAFDSIAIRLPKPRCISVDSVVYLDPTGTSQTIDPSTYYVDTSSEPARLVPKSGLTWPYTQTYLPGSITVTFTTGSYATPADVPNTIVMAILLLCGHWYAHSESTTEAMLNEIPFGVKALLDLHKYTCMSYEGP